jgi:hypothetical protein
MKREYKTKIYKDPTPVLLVLIPLNTITIFAILYLARAYDFKSLGVFLAMLVLCYPIFLSNKFRKALTVDAVLAFSNSDLKITIHGNTNEKQISEFSCAWDELNKYRFYFDSKLNSCLTLYFIDETKKTFIFRDDNKVDNASYPDSVYHIFCDYIRTYNESNERQILLQKGVL